MTGGVPEDDIALRVLQVFVQAPPLLLSTANHSFTDDVHGEHVPQRVQATLGGYRVGAAVRLHDASCSVSFGEGATP